MDKLLAYSKIDNLCCVNSHNPGFFDAFKDSHDDDFCRDVPEMVDALETIYAELGLDPHTLSWDALPFPEGSDTAIVYATDSSGRFYKIEAIHHKSSYLDYKMAVVYYIMGKPPLLEADVCNAPTLVGMTVHQEVSHLFDALRLIRVPTPLTEKELQELWNKASLQKNPQKSK